MQNIHWHCCQRFDRDAADIFMQKVDLQTPELYCKDRSSKSRIIAQPLHPGQSSFYSLIFFIISSCDDSPNRNNVNAKFSRMILLNINSEPRTMSHLSFVLAESGCCQLTIDVGRFSSSLLRQPMGGKMISRIGNQYQSQPTSRSLALSSAGEFFEIPLFALLHI